MKGPEILATAGAPLDRHLRDVMTVSQHILGQTRIFEMAGGMWLGQPSPLPVL